MPETKEKDTMRGKVRLVRKLLRLAVQKLEDLEQDLKDPQALQKELGSLLSVVAESEEKLERVLDLYLKAEERKREALGRER